jgi:hypothetical protein
MKAKKLPLFQEPAAKKVLNQACQRHSASIKLLQDLLELQHRYIGSGRQQGITGEIDSILDEYIDQ